MQKQLKNNSKREGKIRRTLIVFLLTGQIYDHSLNHLRVRVNKPFPGATGQVLPLVREAILTS